MSESVLDEFDKKLKKDIGFGSNDDGAGNDVDFTEEALDEENKAKKPVSHNPKDKKGDKKVENEKKDPKDLVVKSIAIQDENGENVELSKFVSGITETSIEKKLANFNNEINNNAVTQKDIEKTISVFSKAYENIQEIKKSIDESNAKVLEALAKSAKAVEDNKDDKKDKDSKKHDDKVKDENIDKCDDGEDMEKSAHISNNDEHPLNKSEEIATPKDNEKPVDKSFNKHDLMDKFNQHLSADINNHMAKSKTNALGTLAKAVFYGQYDDEDKAMFIDYANGKSANELNIY